MELPEIENYKIVLFDTLKDGDEFNVNVDFMVYLDNVSPERFTRRIYGDQIVYTDGSPMLLPEFVHQQIGKYVYVKETTKLLTGEVNYG